MVSYAHKIIFAVSASALISVSAFADPAKGKDKNPKHNQGAVPGYVKDCPPGLRDKGCMPPGQAKKYQIGQPLPIDYKRLVDYRMYGLTPPSDGYYYSKVDRDIVLVSAATRNVVELVQIIDELVD